MTAIGFSHCLCDNGLRLPQDLSVTGYDNIPESKFAYPPLTTVDVCAEGVGAAAVDALLGRLRNGRQGPPCMRTMAASLVVRSSVRRLS